MNAKIRAVSILGAIALLLMSPNRAASDPCCIIIVPPPPPPPPPSAVKVPTRVGEIAAQLPLFAAVERRLFPRAVNVTFRRAPFREAVDMVLQNRGALGVGTVNAVAVYKSSTRASLEIGAVMVKRADFALYARPGGPTKLADLQGKTVGVPAVGDCQNLFINEALRRAGISKDKVTFLAVGDSGVTAVSAGRVDAVPLPVGAEASLPELRQIELPLTLPSWVLYSSSATLSAEAKEVADLFVGISRAVEILRTDPALTRLILQREFNVSDPSTLDVMVQRYIPPLLPDSIRPDPKAVQEAVEMLSSIGQVQKGTTILDSRMLQKLF